MTFIHAHASDDGTIRLYKRGRGAFLSAISDRQPIFCHLYQEKGRKLKLEEPLRLGDDVIRTVPLIPARASMDVAWNDKNVLKTLEAPSYTALKGFVEARLRDPGLIFFDLMPPLYLYCLKKRIEFFANYDKPSMLVFDIEALHPTGAFPKPGRPEDKVICIAVAYGRLGDEPRIKSFSLADFKDEKGLVSAFENFIHERDPDIIATYSTFDIDFLLRRFGSLKIGFKGASPEARKAFIGRARKEGLRVIIPGRNYVDLLSLVMGHPQRREADSLKLEDMAAFFGVSSRRVKPLMADEIVRLWKNRPEVVETYCEDDAAEAYGLANILLPVELQLSRMLLLPLDEVVTMSRYALMLRLITIRAHGRGVAVPVLPRQAHEHYEGAISKCYHRGLFKRVIKIDVKSLYPNIMRQFKIKPDLGVIGDIYLECLDELTEERLKLKAKLKQLDRSSPEYARLNAHQQALKLLINSAYGMLGYANGIFYSRERAAEVTKHGREVLTKIVEIAESRGCGALEVDTDGLLLQIPEDLSVEELVEDINKALPPLIKVDVEGRWEYGLIHKAKNYMLYNPGELVIKGSAFKGAKFRRFSREILRSAAIAFFKSGGALEPVRTLLAKARAKLESGDFDPRDVCIRATLSRPLHAYADHNVPHLAAARKLKEELGVELGPGEAVEFYIAKGSGPKYLRAKPVQLFKPEDIDIADVLEEAYKLVARMVSAAHGISSKEALAALVHREIVPVEHEKARLTPEKPEGVGGIEEQPAPLKLPALGLETEPAGPKESEELEKPDFACLIRAPELPLTIFNYGGVIRPEHPLLRELPNGLKSYLVFSHVRALGRDIHLHPIDVDEVMDMKLYRRLEWKLRPLRIFSYKTTEAPEGGFKAHFIVPVVFSGEYEEQRAIRKVMKKRVRALGIPDDPGNRGVWTRMPLFMFGLSNTSTKHGQEIAWIRRPADLGELLEAAHFNRLVLEDDIRRALLELREFTLLKRLPPCIEKIVEAPLEWGQKLSDLKGYRHAIYISLCWALGSYSGISRKEAKRIALEFARGLKYDETHTSSAEYQFNYCYERPFAIDCEALKAAGLCDEKCPRREG